MAKRVPMFDPSNFTATSFSSAEEKARTAEQLVRFIALGFRETMFTKSLYTHLHLHLFSHIAHTNKAGFYWEWFATPAKQQDWFAYVAKMGDRYWSNPAHSWCDVEKVIVDYLVSSGRVSEDALD